MSQEQLKDSLPKVYVENGIVKNMEDLLKDRPWTDRPADDAICFSVRSVKCDYNGETCNLIECNYCGGLAKILLTTLTKDGNTNLRDKIVNYRYFPKNYRFSHDGSIKENDEKSLNQPIIYAETDRNLPRGIMKTFYLVYYKDSYPEMSIHDIEEGVTDFFDTLSDYNFSEWSEEKKNDLKNWINSLEFGKVATFNNKYNVVKVTQ